ncbi:hypothetical protein RJ640_012153 [Escallonia rubra]|uniref:Histone-lysine N-methyltransferase SUVR5 n=1 Tax=Escallonia rubra TaxID=112253 RepID=A0AA88UJM4_9ASTE|nr:hypothetical protein RJ640_012153 [Escallonia rubra]
MEVLPCSGVCYAGESNCPQQDSGINRDRESNCLGHAEHVQMADVKLDDIMPTVEGSHEEQQGGVQWIVDGNYNGDSSYEFGVEGQKLSCDFHDSEDDSLNAQDSCTGPSGAPDNNSNGTELPSSHREGEFPLSDSNWLGQDEPMAVWVKWRGKWQAGIRCARTDWPLSTLKAKPTHDRKQYLVIFFPRTRNYSWADVLLVRPISEYPEPIAYKTHKVGVKMVKDLTLARRFIMQRLAVSMLNVIDQLRCEALMENARNVMVWKEFAMEASRCKGYPDLGRMLPKLQNMILHSCLSSSWLQDSLQSWVQKCQNALSAESVEMLKEELVDSILWNEVNSFPNVAMQPEMGSEWRTWKQEVMKWFSTSHPISNGGDVERQINDSPSGMGVQISRKRPKLEVRRAETHASQVEAQVSHQPTTVEIDSGFFDSRAVNAAALESEPSRDETLALPNSPGKEPDRWGDIVVEDGNSIVARTKIGEVTPTNGMVAQKSLESGSKNRQCLAFIEAKGRQCVRYANEGDVYCCVHLASRFVGNSAKAEATPPVDAPLCGGTTVLGTKCKHRSLPGSSFCKKHRPQKDTRMPSTSSENRLKRKHEESISRSESINCKEIVLVGEVEPPLHVDPISVMGGVYMGRSLIKMAEQPSIVHTGTEMLQCIGLCTQDASGPCLESPKRHSLYCEKHLPSWLKRARNGKSRIVSKEVFMDLLRECYSREQKLHLHQACELFYRLFKSILSLRNPVPKEVQLQWAISEASKDVRVGEVLMKLVCSEKERLNRLWGFNVDKDAQNSFTVKEAAPAPVANDSDHDNETVIRCKICSQKFVDDQALGAHWMDSHKKEAQWLFRGYVCAICLDSFTNKKGLEAHVQERHHVQFVEQCMLYQCIPCGSHFGNQDQLWLHVLSVHPANFKPSNSAQQHVLPVFEYSSQKLEPSNLALEDKNNPENQGSARKFICRFCGLKFDLLPDLGRHHQAAHMGSTSVGPRLPKRGIRFYAHKLKSGRLTRPRFRKGMGAASYAIRNRGNAMKKRIQATNTISTDEIKVQSTVAEADSLGRLAESQCSAVAKILFSEIKKTKPRPSNFEILSIARSACCKVRLQVLLEEKYGCLPERLYLKAAKLCSEHNILVDWHLEGFICPKGCKPITEPHMESALMPLSDGEVRHTSSLPSDPVTNEWEMDECHYVIDSRHFRQEPVQRSIILCDDISFGQESVPIACVVDESLLGSLHMLEDGSDDQTTEYSMPWECFTYITKPLVDQSIGVETESLQLGCACARLTCSSETCDHVYLFDTDYEDAKDIYGRPMNGRFPYDERRRIILEEGYLVYECNHQCRCTRTCQNRVLQNGVQAKLEVFKTEKKGWAVRAGEAIMRGTFVCEFIGEVLDEQEANKRRNRYGREDCSYFHDIDAHSNDMSRLIDNPVPYVIDASQYGNVSRYINHSCSPNLMNHQVLVESMDCPRSHIGLYASCDIAMGEELTYNYRYKQLDGEGWPCHCGASNCKGRLY